MRATVPPEMEVFINLQAIGIEASKRLSTDDQKAWIAQAATSFREQLPEEVRPFVDLHMVDPSTLIQLEDASVAAGRGFILPKFSVRTDVQTEEGWVAAVDHGLFFLHRVRQAKRDEGYSNLLAVPVGVLPRKLTA